MSLYNFELLGKFFTGNNIRDLVENNTTVLYENIKQTILKDYNFKNNKEVIEQLYEMLSENYRNEYFYQNTLINKILLGVHSPRTTSALTQVKISKSIADLILINGKATVYEIKSDLDSFSRLKNQIEDYYKAFSYVYVVTNERNFEQLETLFEGEPVGIRVITSGNTVSRKYFKKAEKHSDRLTHNDMFSLLNKQEYEDILINYFGETPDVSQVFYRSECRKLFTEIPILRAEQLVHNTLKKRVNITKKELDKIPFELKSIYYFHNEEKRSTQKLYQFLNSI